MIYPIDSVSARRDGSGRGGLGWHNKRVDYVHTDTKMGVNRGITGSSGQVLDLSVWDVKMDLGVAVRLGQTKIDNINLVTTLSGALNEVIRLDITVEEEFGVDVLDTGDTLVGQEQDSLQRELAVAEVEQVLRTGFEEVKKMAL